MAELRPSQRYRTVDGRKLIEVRVRSALQLFDSRDPAPFRDRDLDDDFLEYVLGAAGEVAPSPFKIVILIEDAPPAGLGDHAIREALRTNLEYQIELKRLHRRKMLKTVRLFLAIGVAFMALFLGLAQVMNRFADAHPVAAAAREGFVIFGWVALWRPFDALLFDWYPSYDQIRSLRRILDAELDIVFKGAAS